MVISREECLARLRGTVSAGRPIIGAGAGTGLSAKCAEAGGVDLIIIYNSGRYRMAGRGSLAGLLPYGDANAIVVEMAREVLPVVRHTPVLANTLSRSRIIIGPPEAPLPGTPRSPPTCGLGTLRARCPARPEGERSHPH